LGWSKSTAPFFSKGGLLRCNSGKLLLLVLRLRDGMISEVRGVRWCEEIERGSSPFIGSTARPRGMGRRQWRHGYGLLEAWLRLAIDGRSPGDALELKCAYRGGGKWSGTRGALRGRGGELQGERWLRGTGGETNMSGGLLGWWGACWRAVRARGGRVAWERRLLCSARRHGRQRRGRSVPGCSGRCLRARAGREGAVRHGLHARQGWHA